MASTQDALLTFFTGLKGFYVYQYDKYAVAGYTKLPGKMVLYVVSHIPQEISRYTWFEIEGGPNITAKVVSTNTTRSPLTQCRLEIETKVTVIW